MRTGISIEVSPPDGDRLEALVRDRNAAQKHAWRACSSVCTSLTLATVHLLMVFLIGFLMNGFRLSASSAGVIDCLRSVVEPVQTAELGACIKYDHVTEFGYRADVVGA